MKNIYKILGDVVEIELRDGERCLIDLYNLDKVDKAIGDRVWYLAQDGYVKGGSPVLIMHRLIADAPKGLVVDHLNHLRWDNRKDNLRVCTQSENSRNRIPTEQLIAIGAKKDWRTPKVETEPFLTNQDVMELLNVSRQTLHVYREKKELPFIKISSRTFRYDKEKVLNWLKEQDRENE